MSAVKTHVKKGDDVVVISGNHRGSTGKILQILTRKNQVLIEGVRMIKKHVKKSAEHQNGAIIEREGPLHISNVKLAAETETAPEKKASRKKN
ncbi:MAG TPA: 50S ribosomal protein L24 [Chthoniobacterales bacterium]|jgi:large subunit ribosomal protein L24